MKKKLLFIIPGLDVGGGEKSLVNLLNEIDYSKYSVDLFLLNYKGAFVTFLPKEVNIIEHSDSLKIFNMKLNKSIIKFLYMGNIKLAYARIMFFIKNKFIKNKSLAEQCSWKYLKEAIGVLNNKYDVAIGYLEKTSNYICIDNVISDSKIGWIHTDYNKLNIDEKFDEKYFDKLDFIITVSPECKYILEQKFKKEKHKIKIIENIISEKNIIKLSNEKLKENYYKENCFNILSVGRLTSEKGFDMAIESCKKLLRKGYKISWCIIGEGYEKERLEEKIRINKLDGIFKLLGEKKNPYPYMKKCDIYVQPSRFEGFGIAIAEARILGKAIVATNFDTVKNQISHKVNGLIVDMNSNDIANGVELLIKDNKLKQKLINNLKYIKCNNEEAVYKLYEILEK